MDIEHIRTFLAVVETGSFLGAADVVNVTQSTVSVRIRTLEESLRTQLFVRSKRGASLTPSGHRFHANATAIVRIWNQSRLDVGLPEDFSSVLRVGAQQSLWDSFLIHWLAWMRQEMPFVALRAETGEGTALMEGITKGTYDICVQYRPQYRPGFVAELIFEEEIVLVTSDANKASPFDETYLLTHWGPEFLADHALSFPAVTKPSISMDLGPIGLQYLLAHGGSGYFPKRTVKALVEQGRLHFIEGMPVFHYPVYLVAPQSIEHNMKQSILSGLKLCANPDVARGQVS
jgi:DNA-binding transcriptional LysR family regulator